VIEVQVQDRQATAAPPTPTPHGSPGTAPPSRLGAFVASFAVIAVGVLGMIDLAGVSVKASTYFAVPLVVTGLGLILGAWYGLARWLIAIGMVLLVALSITAAVEALGGVDRSTTWKPATIDQLDRTYTLGLGSAVLDLSGLDFAGRSEAVEVRVDVGDLTIIVPPDVDVRAEATVDVGNMTLFGTSWGGIGQSTRTVTDLGVDGPGGGELTISGTVDVGDLEVRR
jgi:hypothetical protein